MSKKKRKFFVLLIIILFLTTSFASLVCAQNPPPEKKESSNPLEWISDKATKLLTGAIFWITKLITFLIYAFINIANHFLRFAIKINFEITNSEVVISAWKIVRDFANLFFAFAMLAIGIATIVGWEEYQAQKMLPKLLIIALLINFSLIFCSAIVDVSNAFSKYFENASLEDKEFSTAGIGVIQTLIQPQKFSIDTTKMQKEYEEKNKDPEKNPGFFVSTGFALAGSTIAIITCLLFLIIIMALIVLFLARFIILSFLIILAPIAWVFYFFPFLEEELSIWKKWWSSFLKWTIIGPALLFFVWLTSFTLSKSINNKDAIQQKSQEITEEIQEHKKSKEILTLGHINLPIYFSAILAIGFLLAGLKMSVELGGYGSEYFYNLGTRVVNKPKEWSWQKVKEVGKGVSYWTARKVSERVPAEGPGWKTKAISKTPLLRIVPRKAIEYSQKERNEFQEKVKTLSTLSVSQLKKLYNLGGGYHQGKFYQQEPILAALAEKGSLLPEHFNKTTLKKIAKSPFGQGFLSERYFIAKPEFSQAIKEKNLPKAMANFIQNLSYQDAKNIKIDNLVENQEKLAGISPDYEKIMKEFYNNLEKSSPKVLESLVSNLKQENLNKFIKSYKESLTKKTPTGKTPFEYLEEVNPNQAKWLKTAPAMALGIDIGQHQPKKRIIIAKP